MIKSKIATYQKGLDVVNAVIWEKVIARKYSHLNRNISSENPNIITQESRKKLSPKVAEERIKIRADINEIVKKKKMQGETSTPLWVRSTKLTNFQLNGLAKKKMKIEITKIGSKIRSVTIESWENEKRLWILWNMMPKKVYNLDEMN